MTTLRESYEQVDAAINDACRSASRTRGEVELMAVSKTYPAAMLAEAASLGMRLFGENRVQEFASKSVDLALASIPGAAMPARQAIRVHLIGHLQSNKAAKAAEVFDAVDSVDSLKLAERLNEAASKLGKKLPVLLEIKLSTEETKAGLAPDSPELSELLEKLPDLSSLHLEGLMTIAPLDVPEDETRACFRELRQLRDRLASAHPQLSFPVLSMGMSGDYALAIAEGATRIRVGTALFGVRPGYQQ